MVARFRKRRAKQVWWTSEEPFSRCPPPLQRRRRRSNQNALALALSHWAFHPSGIERFSARHPSGSCS